MKKPELRMKKPNLELGKLPKPVADLVTDLRQHGLLPVAIGLVVAILAVPLLLSSGSDKRPAALSNSPATAASAAPGAQALVVSEGQSLRDYRKRLAHKGAKDPFAQKFTTAAGASGAGGTLQSPSAESSGVTAAATAGEAKAAKGGGSGGGGSKSAPDTKTNHIAYEIDARAGRTGNLKLLEGVQRFSPLPSAAKPTAVFVGVTDHAKKALFQISSSVLTLSGDGVCLFGVGRCDLLELKEGQKATMLFGPDGLTYSLKVVHINRVITTT